MKSGDLNTEPTPVKSNFSRAPLSDEQRRLLVSIARSAVASGLGVGEPVATERIDLTLRRRCGVFVTLRIGEELRGCIGMLQPTERLHDAVSRCAQLAATEDPRFPPLTVEELPAARFEISLLSPPRVVAPDRVVVGRDGVIVSAGTARGLLLPQVATERGWNAEELLSAACEKAGLRPSAWREPGAQVEAFTAEVFGE